MRWLILSDVHSNIEALDGVLREADARWGRLPVACAGDVVGLGPSPNECVRRLREREAVAVAGNHDLMVLGQIARPRCTPAGLRAVEWTRSRLDASAREWLASLPAVREVAGGFVLCHGSLDDPDEYVVGEDAARRQLALLARRFPGRLLLVYGHTHHAVWAPAGRAVAAPAGLRASMDGSPSALVNPGSVGQSRSAERAARYLVLDTAAGTLEFGAAAYDVRACERKIRAAGLGTRLYRGTAARWTGRCRALLQHAGRLVSRG